MHRAIVAIVVVCTHAILGAAQEPKPAGVLQGSWGLPDQLLFSGDGKRLASLGPRQGFDMQFQSVVNVWEMPSRKLVKSIAIPQATASLAISEDGGSVAVVKFDQARMESHASVFDAKSGRQKCQIHDQAGAITALALSPDEKTLAMGWNQRKNPPANKTPVMYGQVVLRDIKTQKIKQTLGGVESAATGPGRQPPHVVALAFSPDGQRIAAGYIDGTIRVWQLETGRELSSYKGRMLGRNGLRWLDAETVSIDFGAETHFMDAASGAAKPLAGRILLASVPKDSEAGRKGEPVKIASYRVRDLAENSDVARLELTVLAISGNRSSASYPAALSPDGKTIVIGTRPGRIQVYDVDQLPKE